MTGRGDMMSDERLVDNANPKYRQLKRGASVLEYTLEDDEITVDWVYGMGALSLIAAVLDAEEASVVRVSGYVTDKLGKACEATLQRLADRVARQLGVEWNATIEVKGNRRFLVLAKRE